MIFEIKANTENPYDTEIKIDGKENWEVSALSFRQTANGFPRLKLCFNGKQHPVVEYIKMFLCKSWTRSVNLWGQHEVREATDQEKGETT